MHKIQKMQQLLSKNGVKAFLLPNCDEFQNEYLPEYNKRIEWLTSFTGSNATLIITPEQCIFSTDGRYIVQAKKELDLDYFTMISKKPWEWLEENKISEVSYDPTLYTETQLTPYIKAGINLITLDHNPVDILWHDRAQFVPSDVKDHSNYAGKSSKNKCQDLAGDEAFFMSDPASICWLLNIRGNDVKHTPLLLCYAILYPNGTVALFLPGKCNIDLDEHVTIYNISALQSILANLQKVALDPTYTVMYFIKMLRAESIIRKEDPCQIAKACKNSIELTGIETAHQRDGIAMTKFLYWLKHTQGWSEKSAADQLLSYRQEQDRFQDLSFSTISAFGEHGAIIHYTTCTDEPISGDNLYLIDSGGQYLDGTTDVTRTVAIGHITEEQKYYYTLVLKGHIALANAIFPIGTTGKQLDILARQYLWRDGQNYPHGTGHGVGHYLGVHEGPHSFSSDIPLQVGMILSNEPGFYKVSEYGIRIESIMQVVEKNDQYLGFKTLTCVPIDLSAVNKSLLSNEEINWLNNYHNTLYNTIKDSLDDTIKEWLENNIFI